MFYIHKYRTSLEYGGPEEGGWWYNASVPLDDWHAPALAHENGELAYEVCRALNEAEYKRREQEEIYDYASTLAHRCNFYVYAITDSPKSFSYPAERPHYE